MIPAIAEKDDIIGREIDEPLLSPIVVEDRDQALMRWNQTRENVGSYTWYGMYQQRPAPPRARSSTRAGGGSGRGTWRRRPTTGVSFTWIRRRSWVASGWTRGT